MSATPPTPAPDRNAYIDTLRGWSIAGVVCVHFAGSFVTTDIHAWSPSFWLGLTLNQVFGFAVPLFLFLSGLLAGTSSKAVSLGDYYRGRLWRIGLPYALASLASFFLLNHYAAWQALPDIGAKFTWLWQHVLFYGVEPTLYFIPLILQLYFLQPALKALPRWLNRLVPALSPAHGALLLTGLLLALHVTLGLLCYRGTLNYYVWGRPNALFWVFYFFAGLHFRSLAGLVSRRTLAVGAGLALLVATVTMAWNGLQLSDRALVGQNFEFNRLDFAYVRPEMLVYDLAMVAGLAAGITLGWTLRTGLFAYLGRYTLEIYLWHILVLYHGAWRYPETLAACRQLPELIVLICAGATLLIAGATEALSRLADFVRHHRLALIKVP
ncbi:MAG: acyltransferase [Opitutae bacterium]|nr:acyltransferase [Opitutae bacterium]